MWEVAAAQFAGGLGKSLGSAIGGDSGPFVGGAATSGAFGTVLDGSGWVVNVGGGNQSATASPIKTTVDPAGFLTPVGSQAQQAGMGPMGLILAGVAFVWLLKYRAS